MGLWPKIGSNLTWIEIDKKWILKRPKKGLKMDLNVAFNELFRIYFVFFHRFFSSFLMTSIWKNSSILPWEIWPCFPVIFKPSNPVFFCKVFFPEWFPWDSRHSNQSLRLKLSSSSPNFSSHIWGNFLTAYNADANKETPFFRSYQRHWYSCKILIPLKNSHGTFNWTKSRLII